MLTASHPGAGDRLTETALLAAALTELARVPPGHNGAVLDLGCGQGRLVADLLARGFDAYGCDFADDWLASDAAAAGRLASIDRHPYRLPYADGHFAAVISVSVLEHVQDKAACLHEVRRVLRPGGVAMHLFPAHWYLPVEPHLLVPLLNWFWPRCPRWWLALWAWLGVRNGFQRGQHWRRVWADNDRYCRAHLSYWSSARYRRLSTAIFGNCRWPMAFYLQHAAGGYPRLARRLPGRWLSGLLSRELRMAFLLQVRAD